MLLENPKHELERAKLMQRPAMQDETRLLAQFYRGVERQSRFDADIARALLRILRSEARVLRAAIEVSPAGEEV